MSYPSSIYAGTLVSGTTLVSDADHANMHNNVQTEITGIETTLGTTGGTSVLKNFQAGDFPARITAAGVLKQRVSGTVDNAILGTPSISGGTVSQAFVGTPNILGGTLANAVIGTSQITGGTISSAVIGTPTFVGGANNYMYTTATGTSTTSNTFIEIDATNLTQSIVTTNSNRVRVSFVTGITNNGVTPLNVFQIVRNPAGSPGTVSQLTYQSSTSNITVLGVVLTALDSPPSGTNTYSVKYKTTSGTLKLLDQPDLTTFSIEELRV